MSGSPQTHTSIGINSSTVRQMETCTQVARKASWKKNWAGPWAVKIRKGGKGKKRDFRRRELCAQRTGGEKQHNIVKALIGKDGWIRGVRMLVNKRWAMIRLWKMLTYPFEKFALSPEVTGSSWRCLDPMTWACWFRNTPRVAVCEVNWQAGEVDARRPIGIFIVIWVVKVKITD